MKTLIDNIWYYYIWFIYKNKWADIGIEWNRATTSVLLGKLWFDGLGGARATPAAWYIGNLVSV